ncbi:unnamed protein product [Moneuplotes crassus]|uniref:Uncharacterized protein n=1 Tax=Euplotes crassus TaxID=5936 RepID=A0AAD1XMG5_EUPCR|nr:unnamed protein product [Moneuplotes crassus]
MEKEVRVKVQYLDSLLKQLINHKKNTRKNYRDDVPAISKRLLSELEGIYKELKEKISKDSISDIGEIECSAFTHPNKPPKRVYKYKFQRDWKLHRQVRKFEIVKNKIVKECQGKIPTCLKSESDKSLTSSLGSPRSSIGIKYIPDQPYERLEESSPVPLLDFVVIDPEVQELKNEYENLEAAYDVIQDFGEIQLDIENQLIKGKNKLLITNIEAQSAAKESGIALKEVEKATSSRWRWLPLKVAAAFGFFGAIGGGIFGNLPGAAIGSASGTAFGGATGALISKAMQHQAKKFHPESPSLLNETDV